MSEQIHVPPPAPPEPSLGRLITEVVRDLQELVQLLIKVAKSELKFSAKAVGFGVAAFGAAVLFLVMVVILGSITAAHLISMTGLHLAWSYLIVTGVYLLGAVVFVLFGLRKFKQVKPPNQTIDTAKQIGETFKTHSSPGETLGAHSPHVQR